VFLVLNKSLDYTKLVKRKEAWIKKKQGTKHKVTNIA